MLSRSSLPCFCGAIYNLRMERRSPKDLIPIASRTKRWRSLNEFEAPYWLGQFRVVRPAKVGVWSIILIGLAAGTVIGLLV